MLIALTAPAPAAADRTAYVTDNSSDTVTPIDIATNTAGTPIPHGGAPVSVAITPDGKTAYVTILRSDGVTPIDIATNTAGTPIPVGGPSLERTAITDRIVLALTANPFYTLQGARPGMRLATVAARLTLPKALRIGVNDWYLTPGHTSYGVLKVRHGTIQEIGLASKRLTTGRGAQVRFMLSFG
jgi:YVTN family beta-propeller protein